MLFKHSGWVSLEIAAKTILFFVIVWWMREKLNEFGVNY
jgi:hypothetical protein